MRCRINRAKSGSLGLRSVPIAALLVLAVVPCVKATGPLDVGNRNQVFIDGRYLESARNVRITVCPPVKTNEKCLEGKFGAYDSILPVDGVFKGFHALTKDGTHWRRVRPGVEPEADDVVGLHDGAPVVFVDPTAPPGERYKRFAAGSIGVSPNGAQWRTVHRKMFPPNAYYPHGMDSQNVCFYDTRLKKYVAYVRVNKGFPCPPQHQAYFEKLSKQRYGGTAKYGLRTIGRSVTEDLASFPMPEVVFEPDEDDPRFDGVGLMDFYTPQVIQYPHAQDAYFLFTARYLHYEDWFVRDDLSEYPRSKAVGILNVGPLDIGFAASRDGIHWERYDRNPWIPLGAEGSFDSKCMYSCRGMFFHGDEIWMYYVAYDTLHGDAKSREPHPVLSRVVLRKDRFTSVAAEYSGGEFTTPPLKFNGEKLALNLDTSALGVLRVEIRDAGGQPIEGYSLTDCDPIHTANSTGRMVAWRGKSDVGPLSGQPVRLRFELLYGVKLHAFRFVEAQ